MPHEALRDPLEAERLRIDEVDERLITLIAERKRISEQIQATRLCAGGSRTDTKREMHVITRYAEVLGPAGRDIALSLLALARGRLPQRNPDLPAVYLGPAGSFSDLARQQLCGPDAPSLALDSLTAVWEAVCQGRAGLGVVPVENTTAGPVTEIMDALALGPEMSIVGEIRLPIDLVLASAHRVQTDKIRTIHTHPHAYAQCASWLAQHVPHARFVPAASTAAGARHVADGADDTEAAICSPVAATRVGLYPLAHGLTGTPAPVTRFLQITRAALPQPPTGQDLTTFVIPARRFSLLTALRAFAEFGIHLHNLHARRVDPSGYLWIDCTGHQHQPPLRDALDRLGGGHIRVLGSYPRITPAPAAHHMRPQTSSRSALSVSHAASTSEGWSSVQKG